MSMMKKRMWWLCIVLGIVLCLLVLFLVAGGVEKVRRLVKSPDSYTWEEYQAMSNEEKDELYHRFDSLEDFEAWKETVAPQIVFPDEHWNEPGKEPDEYAWEEYQALSAEKKEAFYQWFASKSDFEGWMEKAKNEETHPTLPIWNKSGKEPKDYSWEEYQSLSYEEKDAFFLWFASKEEFEAWMDAVRPVENAPTVPIWNHPEKKPVEYTWAEYQELTPQEQDAFYLWFDSQKEFEAWMNKAMSQESGNAPTSWDQSGKQPDEYSFAEYQALSSEDQNLFYQWFVSGDAFEEWLNQAEQESDIIK